MRLYANPKTDKYPTIRHIDIMTGDKLVGTFDAKTSNDGARLFYPPEILSLFQNEFAWCSDLKVTEPFLRQGYGTPTWALGVVGVLMSNPRTYNFYTVDKARNPKEPEGNYTNWTTNHIEPMFELLRKKFGVEANILWATTYAHRNHFFWQALGDPQERTFLRKNFENGHFYLDI